MMSTQVEFMTEIVGSAIVVKWAYKAAKQQKLTTLFIGELVHYVLFFKKIAKILILSCLHNALMLSL